MIIDKEVEVRISSTTQKYYRELGYIFSKNGDIIKVRIEDLSKGSQVRINCVCTNCADTKSIVYKNYNLQISRGDYFCKACRGHKLSISLVNKKLNDPNYYINRIEKSEQTCLERYGYKNYSQTSEFKEKCKNTCIKNYGVENPSQSSIVKNIKKETFLLNYGVDHYFKTNEFKQKMQYTFLERWKVDNPFKSEEIIKNIKITNINNGRWSGDNKNYREYRRTLDYLTKKNKEILFSNWSGYDYYDNEYIKKNLNLDKNNSNYPSIDHKMSALFGFLNKISPDEIADINNLCITKRYINSSKNSKNENEFKSN